MSICLRSPGVSTSLRRLAPSLDMTFHPAKTDYQGIIKLAAPLLRLQSGFVLPRWSAAATYWSQPRTISGALRAPLRPCAMFQAMCALNARFRSLSACRRSCAGWRRSRLAAEGSPSASMPRSFRGRPAMCVGSAASVASAGTGGLGCSWAKRGLVCWCAIVGARPMPSRHPIWAELVPVPSCTVVPGVL